LVKENLVLTCGGSCACGGTETVNRQRQPKLSKLQKCILRNLATADDFRGENIRSLSWKVAEQTEGFNTKNMEAWRERRYKEIWQQMMKGEISEADGYMSIALIKGSHKHPKHEKVLTLKFRAAFARSLARLEKRGLILKLVDLKMEERNGEWFWVTYTGNGRTKRVKLTEKGKDVSNKMLTVSRLEER